MPTMLKVLVISAGLALIVGGTLSLRSTPEPQAPQLTEKQVTELAPATPPVASKPRPVNDASELPAPPADEDPDLEDGSGS